MNPIELHEKAHDLTIARRFAEAIAVETEALKLFRVQLADNDPNLAVALTNLGYCYGELGEWRQALTHYAEGLAIKIRRFGSENVNCAKTYFHVARCHEALGNIDEAQRHYEKSFAIGKAHLDALPGFAREVNRRHLVLLEAGHRSPEMAPVIRAGLRLALDDLRHKRPKADSTWEALAATAVHCGDLSGLVEICFEELDPENACAFLRRTIDAWVNRARSRSGAIDREFPPDEEWRREQQAARAAFPNNPDRARECAERAVAIAREKFGDRSFAAAISWNLLGAAQQALRQPEEALRCIQECMACIRASAGREHGLYLMALADAAATLDLLGRREEAEPLLRENVEIQRLQRPPKPRELALAIHDLAVLRGDLGAKDELLAGLTEAENVLEASDSLRRVFELHRRAVSRAAENPLGPGLPPEHQQRLEELIAQSGTLSKSDLIARTAELYQATRDYLPESSFHHFTLLIGLGRVLLSAGENHGAVQFLEHAMRVAREHHGKAGDPTPALAADPLSRAYFAVGRYGEAEPLFEQAAAFYTTQYGAEDNRTLMLRNQQGLNLLQLGRHAEAESLLSSTLDAFIRSDPRSGDAVGAMANLAVLYRHAGKYREADRMHANIIELARDVFGPQSQEHLKALNNAALFNAVVGRGARARKLYEQALAITETFPSRSNLDRALVLNNLGLFLIDTNEVSRGEELLAEACAIRRELLGELHHDYIVVMHNLGTAHYHAKRWAEAAKILGQALELKEKVFGPDHVSVAITLNCLGEVVDHLGNPARARECFTRSIAIRSAALHDRHPTLAVAFGRLAQYEWQHRNPEAALASFVRAFGIYRRVVDELFPGMTESERALYWDSIRIVFEIFATFAVETRDRCGAVRGELYDMLLMTRALVLESVVRMRSAIAASADPEMHLAFEQWLAKKREVAAHRAARSDGPAEGLDELELLGQEEAFEKKWVGRLVRDLKPPESIQPTWREIRTQLRSSDAAVEIVRTFSGSESSVKTPKYFALVLRADAMDGPRLVELGDANHLDGAALTRYREGLAGISSLSYDEYWAPLQRELEGIDRVYFSPDGVYNAIDLNTLFDGDRFLIDRLDLQVVTSTRELLQPESVSSGTKSAALFGRPAYGSAAFPDLPGTEIEVHELDSLLRRQSWEVKVHLGEAATRSALLEVANPRLLHIATHGFFHELHKTRIRGASGQQLAILSETNPADDAGFAVLEEELRRRGAEIAPGLVEYRSAQEESVLMNPLFRSGLVLAGRDNGLFTAYDATGLKLTGTELVVLSACDSGRGMIRAGEGAIGLVRALRAAGARFTLTTLWPVDDVIVRTFMLDLYQRLTAGEEMHSALRRAILALKEEYSLPLLWGGYVLSGR